MTFCDDGEKDRCDLLDLMFLPLVVVKDRWTTDCENSAEVTINFGDCVSVPKSQLVA